MLDRDLGVPGDGGIPTDRVSPYQEMIDVLKRAKSSTPEERIRILQSDLSPSPITHPVRRPLWSEVPWADRPSLRPPHGPYFYGLVLYSKDASREGFIQLRTHSQSYDTFQPAEELRQRMAEEVEGNSVVILRTGGFYINFSDLVERDVVGIRDSGTALREVIKAHFAGYEFGSIDRRQFRR